MTSIGVTAYLLFLNEPILALISSIVFAKLIIFHFVMEYFDKKISGNKFQKNSNYEDKIKRSKFH